MQGPLNLSSDLVTQGKISQQHTSELCFYKGLGVTCRKNGKGKELADKSKNKPCEGTAQCTRGRYHCIASERPSEIDDEGSCKLNDGGFLCQALCQILLPP